MEKVLIWILILFSTGTAFSQAQPALQFDTPHDTFGEVYQSNTIKHRFHFTNFGEQPVKIQHVHVRIARGKGYATPEVIEPGQDGEIYIEVPGNLFLGRSSFRVGVDTDDPAMPRYRLSLSGFVSSAFDPEVVHLDFGDVEVGVEKVIEQEIFCREVAKLELSGSTDLPGLITMSAPERIGITAEGIKIKFAINAPVLAGLVSGSFHLETNVPHQSRLLVTFSAKIFGDIVPEESPVNMGLIRLGEVQTKTVRLISRSGKPFKVAKVTSSDEEMKAEAQLVKGNAAEALILLTKTATQKGKFTGDVMVHIEGQTTPIPLSFQGLGASPGANVKKVNMEAAQ